MYLQVMAHWHQYSVAGCCGRWDKLGVGMAAIVIHQKDGATGLSLSVLGCGQHDEGVPTTAVVIAIINAGVAMVIVFILTTEGGGDWHRQWWYE